MRLITEPAKTPEGARGCWARRLRALPHNRAERNRVGPAGVRGGHGDQRLAGQGRCKPPAEDEVALCVLHRTTGGGRSVLLERSQVEALHEWLGRGSPKGGPEFPGSAGGTTAMTWASGAATRNPATTATAKAIRSAGGRAVNPAARPGREAGREPGSRWRPGTPAARAGTTPRVDPARPRHRLPAVLPGTALRPGPRRARRRARQLRTGDQALVIASDLCNEGTNGNGTKAHHRPAD